MSIVIDTNALVYAAVSDMPDHGNVVSAMRRWTAGPGQWHVTWSILYEFARIVTHPRVLSRPFNPVEVRNAIAAIVGHPLCSILRETDAHHGVMESVVEECRGVPRGNFYHDCHIAALMREHGVRRILTADRDFERFPFVERVGMEDTGFKVQKE